jgi:RNA polymerase subunit RPABC4/transcription elongation factor Spt4
LELSTAFLGKDNSRKNSNNACEKIMFSTEEGCPVCGGKHPKK